MGIFDRLRSAGRIASSAELLPAPKSSTPRSYAYATPFRSGEPQLVRTIVADVMTGQQDSELTREKALQLPAVANGRAQIIARLAARPLRDYSKGGLTEKQPTWLYRTNGLLGPWQRMARTLDDLIFYGESLWLTERGGDADPDRDGRHEVLDAVQWPRELWKVDDDRTIQLRATANSDQWFPADREQVLYIPGPFDGLLKSARKTIEGGLALEQAWVDAAESPVPSIMLREKEENPLDAGDEETGVGDEIDAVIEQVAKARRDPKGRVMFVPWWIEAEVVGTQAAELLVEGRNAVRLDIAAHLGLPAASVGAALPKASLNYETQEGTTAELHDRLDYWTAPIEEALSGDLMTPRGRRVRFDFADAGHPTGPTTED